jgi:hypothetical protein
LADSKVSASIVGSDISTVEIPTVLTSLGLRLVEV